MKEELMEFSLNEFHWIDKINKMSASGIVARDALFAAIDSFLYEE